MPPASAPQGFLNLNKPPGWTSHDCVAKLRRLLGTKKIGHGGTLDPAATGVLPIALGRATRLLQYLPTDKAYRAVVRFGLTTDTDDLEGRVIAQQSAAGLTQAEVTAALPQFTGTLRQIPPRYSAIQVNGQRLYDLARAGQAVDVPERTVVVHRLQVLDWQAGTAPELTLAIDCGAGTYIRAIARDLGAALGTGATLASLQRTRSSGFTLDTSLTLAALSKQIETETFVPLPPEAAVRSLPAVYLSAEIAQCWRLGQRVTLAASLPPDTPLRVIGPDGTFLGIGSAQAQTPAGWVLSHRLVFAPG